MASKDFRNSGIGKTAAGTAATITPIVPTQPKPTNTYTSKGTYFDAEMGAVDKQRVAALSAQYNAAIAAGNRALANQYHSQAEDIRAKYGYSGGTDGSEYMALLKADPNTSGNQSISSYNLSDYGMVNTAGIDPTKASLMGKSLGDIYSIDYDKDTILSLLNGATKAQYDAQRQTTQETTDDFYNQMSASQAGLLDTLRSNQAGAVATGASKGMAAAQELSALLGLQATNTQGATDLANAKNKLDAEEAAAYAANAKAALDTSNSLKQAIANLDSTKYGYDTQGYASELDYTAALKAVLGEIIQSQNSANATIANANANLEGTKYAADSNKNSSYSSSKTYTSGSSNAAASGSGTSTTVKPAEPAATVKYANTGVGNDQYTKNSDGTYTVYPEKGGTGTTLDEAGWQTYHMEGTLDAVENNSYGTNTVKAALKTAGSQVPTSAPFNKVGAGLGGWGAYNGGQYVKDSNNAITVNGGQYVKKSNGTWYTKTKTGMSKTSDPFNSLINANTTPTHITVDSRSYTYNEDKGYWLCNGKRVSASTVAGALKSGTYFSWSK